MDINDYLKNIIHVESIDVKEFIESYSNIFPLLNRYETTEQDNIWHGEGDVLIHTQMVVDEMLKIISSNNFTDDEKQSLLIAAIFHDYAKPICTKEEYSDKYNRVTIRSPRHESTGRNLLTFLLADKGLSDKVYLNILHLVGEHQTPKHLIIKDKQFNDYVKLAMKVDLKLLYWLEIADMNGRISDDIESQLDYIELFKSESERYNLWNNEFFDTWYDKQLIDENLKDFAIYNKGLYDLINGDIFDKSEAIARSFTKSGKPFNIVTVLVGLPASGKSTYTNKILDDNTKVISLDSIRKELLGSEECFDDESLVHSTGKNRVKEYLRSGFNIVYDATNMRYDFRDSILSIAKDYNALTKIILFPISKNRCLDNQNKRTRKAPEYVYDRMIKAFQFPNITEAHKFEIYNY